LPFLSVLCITVLPYVQSVEVENIVEEEEEEEEEEKRIECRREKQSSTKKLG
jgi:hypothetical protein